MKTEEVLKELIEFYDRRGVGNTTAMMKGAENCGQVFVMGDTYAHAANLTRGHPNMIPVTIHTLMMRSVGQRVPLLIDHYALQNILCAAYTEMVNLERRVGELETISSIRNAKIEYLARENKRLQSRTVYGITRRLWSKIRR